MMKQQIRFFESLTRLKRLEYKPIILLLNKTDALEQLITIEPISDYFEDYTAGANCFHACQFFADKFAESDRRADGNLRIYGTCAAEENCFRGTLQSLQARPLRHNKKKRSNKLGGEASIHNPVALSYVEMLREQYEETFSKTLYQSQAAREKLPPISNRTLFEKARRKQDLQGPSYSAKEGEAFASAQRGKFIALRALLTRGTYV